MVETYGAGARSSRTGRLDTSDLRLSELLGEPANEPGEEMTQECDWCGKPCGNEYIVVAEDRCDNVCPLCWGRSPDYLELREEEGLDPAASLDRLGVTLD